MSDFVPTELLPLGPDTTTYRLLSTDGVDTIDTAVGRFLRVSPEAITSLTAAAMFEIEHFLRTSHLAQLASILDDPEASGNDRFVALDLLRNANIAAGGVLPGCQDTGTAIVKAKKGQFVLTEGRDEDAIARGVFETFRNDNLRYSQMAPLDMYREVNTGTNLPAEIEISAVDGDAYKFFFMAKGGGSANKSYLFQETKAVLNPASLRAFIADKMDLLGTSACPPYHLAVVIGGTSAEFALKTAKMASARYLDSLPLTGSESGHGFRDLELEAEFLKVAQQSGIGAQFGGKYFCHDVRVIRLPRHGASCPIAIAVSCAADRQALGKITAEGIFLEQLEHDPAQFLPEVVESDLDGDVVRIDHFLGFEAYWSVPAGRPNARVGAWVPGPGMDFFRRVRAVLPEARLIAEDLGLLTPETVALREASGLPGMAVLQFAFGGGADNAYLPHNHTANSVVYPGTHDNDTTLGWYNSADERTRDHVRRYLRVSGSEIGWDFIRSAYASVARLAIISLPDLLSLGSEARLNTPGVGQGNWTWRYRSEQLARVAAQSAPYLRELGELHGRLPAVSPASEKR